MEFNLEPLFGNSISRALTAHTSLTAKLYNGSVHFLAALVRGVFQSTLYTLAVHVF